MLKFGWKKLCVKLENCKKNQFKKMSRSNLTKMLDVVNEDNENCCIAWIYLRHGALL